MDSMSLVPVGAVELSRAIHEEDMLALTVAKVVRSLDTTYSSYKVSSDVVKQSGISLLSIL